jgi:hypothetical protein
VNKPSFRHTSEYLDTGAIQSWITYRLNSGQSGLDKRDLEAMRWLVRVAKLEWLEKERWHAANTTTR